MTNFISDVLLDLKSKGIAFSNLTFIVPSKRSGVFIKHHLSEIVDNPIFAPEIFSIEKFVEELSNLKPLSNVELLFEFYTTYIHLTDKKELESFESFSKWAQVLLQDFNEIDRYLINQEAVFNYLSAIQDLQHWSLDGSKKTDFINNYLAFWKKLYAYYSHFTKQLLNKKTGYQGLIYREAVENIQNYIENNSTKKHVFLGFNALNAAEEVIIQELLQNDLAEIYWDIDATFYNNKNHDAGLFIRHHLEKWPYFKNNTASWISNNYATEKSISVIGIPKNVGQAKYIGTLLKQLSEQDSSLNNTAVILGDETLLLPVINSIPDTISSLNVTMGLPLKDIPLATLFEKLYYIHSKPSSEFYYKDVLNILTHPFISLFFESNDLTNIINLIRENNIVYTTKNKLIVFAPDYKDIFNNLFTSWENDVAKALASCQELIFKIKTHLETTKHSSALNLEYLFRFMKLFNELSRLNKMYNHLKDIPALFSVYKELLHSETLDFKGEPLKGLQIMGMLESRVLDFETLIISSVNEGILPSGKSHNSFIPFDVKLENNLPTYKEKGAVYSYHFYRLLQRAKTVYILYNTEIDTLTGGEKSRFIKQLELENIHKLSQSIVTPKVPFLDKKPVEIKKDADILTQIQVYANKGFSPSALTSYIRNPIDFYSQKVLKIKEYDDVEETIAANTLGTVIHNTLEDFYKPHIGKALSENIITTMKSQIANTVAYHFKDLYKDGNITTGKNIIAYEIAKRYISNFLDLEIADLQNGNEIQILEIEVEHKISLNIPELDFPVHITGKIDRVDIRNGVVRIIDYKTGKVAQNQLEICNWEDLTTDYDKYSKSFQILCYALMMNHPNSINNPLEAGVISFKNLNSGFLKFTKKDKPGAYANKIELIDDIILDCFYNELKQLIIEICNPDNSFLEKDIKK